MNGPGVLVGFVAVLGAASIVLLTLVVVSRIARLALDSARQSRVGPHRHALLTIASGEDEGGAAAAAIAGLPARTWAVVREAAVAMLGKVRGEPAAQLVRVLDRRGELDRARAGLRSRSAVRRARSAHLLGLARRDGDADALLALLTDRSAEVRLVAARSLGLIGAPRAAGALFDALRPVRGRPGVPTAVVAEAVLGLGVGALPAVAGALRSGDVDQRVVATLVAADGAFAAVLPQLRGLLAGDPALDVRIFSAEAIGVAGAAPDVAALAEHTTAGQPAELRRVAAAALGELGHPAAADVLAGLLADPDVRLAQLSGDALVGLGPAGARLLARVADTGAPAARVAAGSLALARLRGGTPTTDGRG